MCFERNSIVLDKISFSQNSICKKLHTIIDIYNAPYYNIGKFK